MNIGAKIISIVLAAFILTLCLIAVAQQLYVAPSFGELEREQVTRNLERVIAALAREITLLGVSAADWAYWDETYRFAASGGTLTDYLDTNLNLSAVDTLGVQMVAVYDLAGRRLAGFTVDLESQQPIDLGDLSYDQLPAGHPLLALSDDSPDASGLVTTPSGVVAAASRHILTNEQQGPPAGFFVLGRLLDESWFEELAEQTRVELSVQAWDEPAEDAWIATGIVAHAPFALTELRDELISESVLADLNGQPALRIGITEPRSITARGVRAVRAAMGSTAIMAIAFIGPFVLFLSRSVVRPLAKLTAHAVQIGESDDLRARIDLRRRDEIGTLGRAFDRMTERLSDARRVLLERSFDAGKAELASGVLHNLGNTITPVVVRLVELRERLERAPAADLKTAVTELGRGVADPERAADLRRFAELAGVELAEVVTKAREEVDAVARQMAHAQQILGDQERLSRAAPVVEQLGVADLVEESVRMLSPVMQRLMAVEMDSSVRSLSTIQGPRIAVQQVISNILINAAEAIAARGDGPGRLRVRSEPAPAGRAASVHLCFGDDGIGLADDQLARVFERGFSTKDRPGSGLGLHWCATTVQAFGGSMRIESEAIGRGATVHLVLPLEAAFAGEPADVASTT